MTTARNDRIETAKARGNLYGFLATVFRAEPTVEFLDQLRTPVFSEVLESIDSSLKKPFNGTPNGILAEDLATEFARLFIGPGPHISPHESTNLDPDIPVESTLWSNETVKVKKFIEATGLEYDGSFAGMPDHIAAELEFMQRLIERESDAWKDEDEEYATNLLKIQKQFLDEHLSQWLPRFCERVIHMTKEPFYAEMAKLTDSFLKFEYELLEDDPAVETVN